MNTVYGPVNQILRLEEQSEWTTAELGERSVRSHCSFGVFALFLLSPPLSQCFLTLLLKEWHDERVNGTEWSEGEKSGAEWTSEQTHISLTLVCFPSLFQLLNNKVKRPVWMSEQGEGRNTGRVNGSFHYFPLTLHSSHIPPTAHRQFTVLPPYLTPTVLHHFTHPYARFRSLRSLASLNVMSE